VEVEVVRVALCLLPTAGARRTKRRAPEKKGGEGVGRGVGKSVGRFLQGPREKKRMKVNVHLLQRKKKSSYLLYFIFIFIVFFHRFVLTQFFGRFVTRGVQKHEKKIRKNPSGLITKNVGGG
jgi:hypothetical protein